MQFAQQKILRSSWRSAPKSPQIASQESLGISWLFVLAKGPEIAKYRTCAASAEVPDKINFKDLNRQTNVSCALTLKHF
jgi:hypothetical protein